MSRTIQLVGARGGQGTSTVAAALALTAAQDQAVTLLSHEPLATAQLLGAPPPFPGHVAQFTPTLAVGGRDLDPSGFVVIDDGPLAVAPGRAGGVERYAVVRGPCYVALATMVGHPDLDVDGIVLLTEEGRALAAGDVATIVGVPVVAELRVAPAVARSIDAGLLASDIECLTELRPLRSVVAARLRQVARGPEPTPAPPSPPPVNQERQPGKLMARRRDSGHGVSW